MASGLKPAVPQPLRNTSGWCCQGVEWSSWSERMRAGRAVAEFEKGRKEVFLAAGVGVAVEVDEIERGVLEHIQHVVAQKLLRLPDGYLGRAARHLVELGQVLLVDGEVIVVVYCELNRADGEDAVLLFRRARDL